MSVKELAIDGRRPALSVAPGLPRGAPQFPKLLVSSVQHPSLCYPPAARLTRPMQPLFNGCAEFDVVRRHLRCYFAALEEAQHAVDPSEVLHGFASFARCEAVRCRAAFTERWAASPSEVRIAIRRGDRC